MLFQPVEDAFKEAISEGVFPGAVLVVGKGAEIVFEGAFGFRSLVPDKTPMQPDTIFDLASLTKPLTAEILLRMASAGAFGLDDKMSSAFVDPDVADDPRSRLAREIGAKGDHSETFAYGPYPIA